MSRHDAFWQRLAATDGRGIRVFEETTGTCHVQSWAELSASASAMATILQGRGIRRGDLVPLCAETTRLFPLLWFGLAWLGATPVPLPPRHAMTSQAAWHARLAGILPHYGHYLCGAGDAGAVRTLIDDQGLDLTLIPIADLARGAGALAPPFVARATLDDDDIAFVQYTSGSTRAPKGIRITWGNLFANVDALCERLAVDADADTLISWLPLYHDMGLIGKFLSAAVTSCDLVLMAPHVFVRRPLQLLRLIHDHRATICSMPNFAYELLLKRLAGQSALPSVASIKWFGVGAEPVRPATMSAFAAAMTPHGLRAGALSPCYGLAEATLAVTVAPVGEPLRIVAAAGGSHVTCGTLLAGFETRIDKVSGTIRIKGPSVARTALIDGEVRSLVDDEGYYDTKDLGRFVDGRLVVLGRSDDLFVVNGENRFPYDIESLVRELIGEGTRCACVSVAAEPGRQDLVVLFERRPQQAGDDEARCAAIRSTVLARAGLRLDAVVPLPPKSLPQTPSGKMQRAQARELYRRLMVPASDAVSDAVSDTVSDAALVLMTSPPAPAPPPSLMTQPSFSPGPSSSPGPTASPDQSPLSRPPRSTQPTPPSRSPSTDAADLFHDTEAL